VLTRRLHELIAVKHLMLVAHLNEHDSAAEFNAKSFVAGHPCRSWRPSLARLLNTSIWHVWLVERATADDNCAEATTNDAVRTYCARVRERAFGARLPVNLVKLAAHVFQ